MKKICFLSYEIINTDTHGTITGEVEINNMTDLDNCIKKIKLNLMEKFKKDDKDIKESHIKILCFSVI